MAELFSDGFEDGTTNAFAIIDASGIMSVVSATTPEMNGTYCLKVTHNGTSTAVLEASLSSANQTDVYYRFYFRMEAAPTTTRVLWQVYDTTGKMALTIDNAGTLTLSDGTNQVDSGPDQLIIDTTYRIEVHVKNHATLGEYAMKIFGGTSSEMEYSVASFDNSDWNQDSFRLEESSWSVGGINYYDSVAAATGDWIGVSTGEGTEAFNVTQDGNLVRIAGTISEVLAEIEQQQISKILYYTDDGTNAKAIGSRV